MNENEFGLPAWQIVGRLSEKNPQLPDHAVQLHGRVAFDVRGGGADDGALIETYPIAINGNTEDNPADLPDRHRQCLRPDVHSV